MYAIHAVRDFPYVRIECINTSSFSIIESLASLRALRYHLASYALKRLFGLQRLAVILPTP